MFASNTMGLTPEGEADLNGFDFWWGDQGEGNCWQENTGADDVTSNTMYPSGLPDCESEGSAGLPNNPYKSGQLAPCALYDRSDPMSGIPPGCDFLRHSARTLGRAVGTRDLVLRTVFLILATWPLIAAALLLRSFLRLLL